MKTRFPWRLWFYTTANENLLELSPEEVAMFSDFCQLAAEPRA